MTTTPRTLRATAFAAALVAAPAAMATNGYFSHGYGIKAQGMGGASTAMAEDSLGGATNPAKMVWVGSRADLGLALFSPHRDAERTGAGVPTIDGKVDSGKTNFLVPELGYNRMVGNDLSLGVTVYGNGGMNTTYPQGNFDCGAGPATANILCGSGKLGVDLMQLVVAPTAAYKVAPQHSVGASLLLGYQMFKATGLQAFDNPGLPFPDFTGAPGSVTNRGYDSASGAGLRVGYMGRLSDMVTVGAAYSSKIDMSKLSKYRGLFAEGGNFDIPSNYNLGVAFMPAPRWTVAFDYQRINYSDSRAVNNPSLPIVAPLGASNGPGFGWQDIDVFKLGVAWQLDDTLTLRAGYNRGDNPIKARDVTFNILAPGVMKEHYTLGFTYAMSKNNELSGALMYAPRQEVRGGSLFNGFGAPFPPNAGGTETIGMRQYSLGLGWSWKF
jgi:long-chain fatty acid transport protein